MHAVCYSESYESLLAQLETWPVSLLLCGILCAHLYHLLAGIRHIILDFSPDHDLRQAWLSAAWLLVIYLGSTVVIVGKILGVWL